MLRMLLMSVLMWRGVSSFVINDICNQWTDDISLRVISSVDRKTKLIQARGEGLPPLIERLIENATSIRPSIMDSFTCDNRVYGYYADQANECQIFHICVPMQQLFPDMYCAEDIFTFSFICPEHTIFNQEAMVCDWTNNAFPCSEADQLYSRNNLLFVVAEEDVQRQSSSEAITTTPSSRPSRCCANRKKKVSSIVRQRTSNVNELGSERAKESIEARNSVRGQRNEVTANNNGISEIVPTEPVTERETESSQVIDSSETDVLSTNGNENEVTTIYSTVNDVLSTNGNENEVTTIYSTINDMVEKEPSTVKINKNTQVSMSESSGLGDITESYGIIKSSEETTIKETAIETTERINEFVNTWQPTDTEVAEYTTNSQTMDTDTTLGQASSIETTPSTIFQVSGNGKFVINSHVHNSQKSSSPKATTVDPPIEPSEHITAAPEEPVTLLGNGKISSTTLETQPPDPVTVRSSVVIDTTQYIPQIPTDDTESDMLNSVTESELTQELTTFSPRYFHLLHPYHWQASSLSKQISGPPSFPWNDPSQKRYHVIEPKFSQPDPPPALREARLPPQPIMFYSAVTGQFYQVPE